LTKADGIHHDAVTDDALLIPKNARRDEVKDVFFAFGNDCVPGVISALSPDDEIGFFGEEIDNFAFSFVAPLEAANDGVHLKKYRAGGVTWRTR